MLKGQVFLLPFPFDDNKTIKFTQARLCLLFLDSEKLRQLYTIPN